MHKKYAKALFELLKSSENTDELISRFFDYLKQKGKIKLLPRITFELERLIEKEKKTSAKLIIASEKFKKQAEKTAEMLGLDSYEIKLDESLVGGYQVKSKDFIWDASFKAYLLQLYNKLKT